MSNLCMALLRKKGSLLAVSCIFIAVVLIACKEDSHPHKKVLQSPPLPEEQSLPIDYVLLLDNSGSIPKGEPRVFAREAIKGFIDLAESGDGISIVTFATDARVIANKSIQNQASRNSLKDAVAEGLTFEGNYTDISKGVELVLNERAALFRGQEKAKPVIILVSDGKLEPEKNLHTAYDGLIRNWQILSETISFYTLGLGETAIHDEFLSDVNGQTMLTRMAEQSGGRFYHVRSVDELVASYASVLRFTKGYGEIADQEFFLTDESTKRLAFLVVKRLPGQQLCRTQDIRISEAKGKEIKYSNYASYNAEDTKIRWHSGSYYDLILLESPSAGQWGMSLENGDSPKAVVLIKNHVLLRYLVSGEYWNEEKKEVMAWLYDQRTESLSARPCQIQIRITPKNSPANQETQSLLDSAKKIYSTTLSLKEKEPPVGEYLITFVARNKEDYFFRKSPAIPIKIKKAFFSFDLPQGTFDKWPFFWKGLHFAAHIDKQHGNYINFLEPPDIILHLDRFEEHEINNFSPVKLARKKSGSKIIYQATQKNLPLGRYRSQLIMKGTLSNGKQVMIESPEFYLTLARPWWTWVFYSIIGVLILMVLIFVSRPKLKGRLNVVQPISESDIVLTKNRHTKKSFKGDWLQFGKGSNVLPELSATAFIISAARGKRVKIKVEQGDVFLEREMMSKPIRKGYLYRNDVLTFTDGGVQYNITVAASKRPPRNRR